MSPVWFHITGSVVVDGLIKLAAVVAAVALIWNKVILPPIRFGRRVEDALQQLKPNGGSSLRDAVDRIEGRVTSIEDRLESIHDRVNLLEKIHEKQAIVEQIVAENAAKLARPTLPPKEKP